MCVRGIFGYNDGRYVCRRISGTYKTIQEAIHASIWSIETTDGELHQEVFEFAVYDIVGEAADAWYKEAIQTITSRGIGVAYTDFKPARLSHQQASMSTELSGRLVPGVEVSIITDDAGMSVLSGITVKVAFIIECGFVIKTAKYKLIE